MRTARRIKFRGTVSSHAEAVALLRNAGDAALITRVRPRALVLACPCGCGVNQPINLDERSGPAWRIYRSAREELSIYPSVWRTDGCCSHYIVWNERIFLFGINLNRQDDEAEPEPPGLAPVAVLCVLDRAYRPLIDIADQLREVPWAVLAGLRALEGDGQVEEGSGDEKGHFRLRSRLAN